MLVGDSTEIGLLRFFPLKNVFIHYSVHLLWKKHGSLQMSQSIENTLNKMAGAFLLTCQKWIHCRYVFANGEGS